MNTKTFFTQYSSLVCCKIDSCSVICHWSAVTLLVSFGCVVDDEAQGDQHPWTHQSQEAHHGLSDQHVAVMAGLRPAGTPLRRRPLHREPVVLNDVAIIGQGGLDNDFLVDLTVQAELWVPLVVQGVSKVPLQVHAVQRVCWGQSSAQNVNLKEGRVVETLPPVVWGGVPPSGGTPHYTIKARGTGVKHGYREIGQKPWPSIS